MVFPAGRPSGAVWTELFLRDLRTAGAGGRPGFLSGLDPAVHAPSCLAELSGSAESDRVLPCSPAHTHRRDRHADLPRASVCRASWHLSPPASVHEPDGAIARHGRSRCGKAFTIPT